MMGDQTKNSFIGHWLLAFDFLGSVHSCVLVLSLRSHCSHTISGKNTRAEDILLSFFVVPVPSIVGTYVQ
jgi:hypothetical protein